MSTMQIRQQFSRKRILWQLFAVRCKQGARRAIWVFAVVALLAPMATLVQ
jgi:hypothetical protein